MAYIFRTVRRSRWYKGQVPPWLEKDDIQADPFTDLQTQSNILSVWSIENDKANLNQIVAALAAGRSTASNLDFALLDERYLSEVKIEIKESRGSSLDFEANKRHCHLIEISGKKLLGLAKLILSKGETNRIPEKKVVELISKAVVGGQIELAKLHLGIQKKVKAVISRNEMG